MTWFYLHITLHDGDEPHEVNVAFWFPSWFNGTLRVRLNVRYNPQTQQATAEVEVVTRLGDWHWPDDEPAGV